MFGCDSRAAVCASRMNCSRRSGDVGELRRQHLDRDLAREPNLAREIHDAHAAAAELALERVLAGERGLKLDEEVVWGRSSGGRSAGGAWAIL